MGAHAPREWEGARKRSAAGGWSEAEVCAEELPLHGRPCMEDNAAASGSSCELANPAQVRQIASQTGVLFLRQMRLVAGRGAVAELLLAGALWRSCCRPGALWEGWSEAEVCAEELAAPRGTLH